MSRTQIGYALKYKHPQNAITIIHKRYPELLKGKSVELDHVNLTPSPKYLRNNEKVFMYNEWRIYDIVRKSNQPVVSDGRMWEVLTARYFSAICLPDCTVMHVTA